MGITYSECVSVAFVILYAKRTRSNILSSLARPFVPYFSTVPYKRCGPGSSISIATDYGLDGPGSNPGGDEIFHASRPALGPTQPSVQWVKGLSRW